MASSMNTPSTMSKQLRENGKVDNALRLRLLVQNAMMLFSLTWLGIRFKWK